MDNEGNDDESYPAVPVKALYAMGSTFRRSTCAGLQCFEFASRQFGIQWRTERAINAAFPAMHGHGPADADGCSF